MEHQPIIFNSPSCILHDRNFSFKLCGSIGDFSTWKPFGGFVTSLQNSRSKFKSKQGTFGEYPELWRNDQNLRQGFILTFFLGGFKDYPFKHIKDMMVVSPFWVMFIWGIYSNPDLKAPRPGLQHSGC